MENIWITSDTHYNHTNIVSGTSRWEDTARCRKFDTLEEHDEKLIMNINEFVRERDTLYHLGDVAFGGHQNVPKFINSLRVKDIRLVIGNHDKNILSSKYDYKKLFTSIQAYKEFKYGYYDFVLCHYAMRVWNKSHRGSIMLYGHSHGSLDEMKPNIANPSWVGDDYFVKNWRTMDVGIDTHPEFRPYHIDEIIDIMKDRPVEFEVDHHDINTN